MLIENIAYKSYTFPMFIIKYISTLKVTHYLWKNLTNEGK